MVFIGEKAEAAAFATASRPTPERVGGIYRYNRAGTLICQEEFYTGENRLVQEPAERVRLLASVLAGVVNGK